MLKGSYALASHTVAYVRVSSTLGFFRQWDFSAEWDFSASGIFPPALISVMCLDIPCLPYGKRICGEQGCFATLHSGHESRHFREKHPGTNPYFLTVDEYERMSSKSKDKIEEQMKEAQTKLKTNTQVVQSIQNVS